VTKAISPMQIQPT